jgi:hypothetical protein
MVPSQLNQDVRAKADAQLLDLSPLKIGIVAAICDRRSM